MEAFAVAATSIASGCSAAKLTLNGKSCSLYGKESFELEDGEGVFVQYGDSETMFYNENGQLYAGEGEEQEALHGSFDANQYLEGAEFDGAAVHDDTDDSAELQFGEPLDFCLVDRE